MQMFGSPAPKALAGSIAPPEGLREVKGTMKTVPVKTGSHYMVLQRDHWIKVKM